MIGCRFLGNCPCGTGWCLLNPKPEENCVARLQNAFRLAQEELNKYKKTGLTPDQIFEMDRLYKEKCEELAVLIDEMIED